MLYYRKKVRGDIMEKIEKLQKAISFLETLSTGIDPVTNLPADENTFKREDISNCLIFSAEILKEVHKNKGEVVQVIRPLKFDTKFLNVENVKISQKPIALATLVMNINKETTNKKMRNLGASLIKHWLVKNGYISEEKVAVLKNVNELRLTDKSEKLGIIEESVVDQTTGEVKSSVKLTEKAQTFILNNLTSIVNETDVEEE